MTYTDIYKEINGKQNFLLSTLCEKYLPSIFNYSFLITPHFTQRLNERNNTGDKDCKLFSSIITKIFKNHLCELLYFVEVLPVNAAILIITEDKKSKLLVEIQEREGDKLILFKTFFNPLQRLRTRIYYELHIK